MSATRFELLASAAQTVTANGATHEVPKIRELLVMVDVTAQSGSFAGGQGLSVFLQCSSDGGTTWFDMPYEMRLTDNNTLHTEGRGGSQAPTDLADNAGAPVERTRGGRNICAGVTPTQTTGKFLATYKVFGDAVRARWVIDGTTPSFTFSVKAIGKD